MISLEEARHLLLDGIEPLGSENVCLSDCAGRVLAEPLISKHDQPPAPLSAMDGYAVRIADLEDGARLLVVGEAPAGVPYSGSVRKGQCVRIATGGLVPEGADHVVVQENVERDGDQVVIRDASGPSFIRPAGMDFKTGAVLLPDGTRIGPAEIGLIAACGRNRLIVYRQPRIAVIATGDELVEPGQSLEPGQIYNSASYLVAALAGAWGGSVVLPPTLSDDKSAIERVIGRLRGEVDLFVPIGGASVGDRDLLRPSFEGLGAAVRFDRVAVVPGKPTWHARFRDGPVVLGLPGNPSSAFVCSQLLLQPLIAKMAGRHPVSGLSLRTARLGKALAANGGREAWLRARVEPNSEGQLVVVADARQDSGLQTPLVGANALLRRGVKAPPAQSGQLVEFLPL